jgi:Na+/H+-dicarboxylate symporter
MKRPRIAMHWQILLGMLAGVIFGLIAIQLGGVKLTVDWIKPFGTIFINALKLIAIPLIITSLIKGVSDLQDLAKLSKMGGRTVGLYLVTTVVAVTLGLIIVNVVQPGKMINEATRIDLVEKYIGDADSKIMDAKAQQEKGPLQPLIDLVPGNIFMAATSNSNMLQVIFVVIFFGIGLLLIKKEKAQPVKAFFDGLNEVVLKLVDVIMLFAPLGVFALLAALIVEAPNKDILVGLLWYSICVVGGLATMIFVFYPALVVLFSGKSY